MRCTVIRVTSYPSSNLCVVSEIKRNCYSTIMETFSTNNSTNVNHSSTTLDFWRHPLHLLIIYFAVYIVVFVVGLIGNSFVIMAVAMNASMRVITNYFITSLATADLLVIIFCVPATLMNNVVLGKVFINVTNNNMYIHSLSPTTTHFHNCITFSTE